MFKSLAVLALAMTGGATLLAWAEPRSDDYANGHSALMAPLIAQRQARAAVGNLSSDKLTRVVAIELAWLPMSKLSAGAALTATLPPATFHFQVDAVGSMQALPLWKQSAVSEVGGVVRIALAGDVNSGRVPTAQWRALRALLAVLGEKSGVPAESFAVRLTAASASPAVDGLEHLQSLLLEDGFVSRLAASD